MRQCFLTLSTLLICEDVIKWVKVKTFETIQTVAEYQARAPDILRQFYRLVYSVRKTAILLRAANKCL
jgi:hypothetical protein